MTRGLNGGAWAEVGEGCPVLCRVSDEHKAYLLIGEAPHQYELTFAIGPMRDLVAKTSAALAQLEARGEPV
ncbi:MAG TPA: hypothetical protein VGP26_30205 [Actinophytocola sp.]|jgi:hypothetical protein|nr:hypothetical protein [Actinophytocola sp.]